MLVGLEEEKVALKALAVGKTVGIVITSVEVWFLVFATIRWLLTAL